MRLKAKQTDRKGPNNEPQLFGVADFAARVGISSVLVRRLCRDGRLRSVSICDRRLIPVEELYRVIEHGIPGKQPAGSVRLEEEVSNVTHG